MSKWKRLQQRLKAADTNEPLTVKVSRPKQSYVIRSSKAQVPSRMLRYLRQNAGAG
jgi:hypothetical protein